MSKPITLDRTVVTEAILTAEGESDAIVRIFKMVYPEFDLITSVEGFVICNKPTWHHICRSFMDLSTRLNAARPVMKQIMPGGAWMNWGFSSSDDRAATLKDWHVLPAPFTITTTTTDPK